VTASSEESIATLESIASTSTTTSEPEPSSNYSGVPMTQPAPSFNSQTWSTVLTTAAPEPAPAPVQSQPTQSPQSPSSRTTQTGAVKSWLPTYIIAETNTAPTNTATTLETTTTTPLPKAIMPTAIVSELPDYELVSIGFKQALNYAFIVEHALASAQIFEYLPKVLLNAFPDLDSNSVIVKKLVPYTSHEVEYIITVAEIYFLKSEFSKLQSLVLDPSSCIYNNTDVTAASLAELIDPKIPVDGLIKTLDQANMQSSSGDSGTDSNSPDTAQSRILQSLGSIDSHALSSSATARAKTMKDKRVIIGIVVGSIVGFILYVYGVIYLLRRRIRRSKEAALSAEGDNGNDTDSSFSGHYPREKLSYNGSQGDVRLETSSDIDRSGRISSNFGTGSFSHLLNIMRLKNDQPKSVPEISAPINVKSSLGW
jgi:hypothetical protein